MSTIGKTIVPMLYDSVENMRFDELLRRAIAHHNIAVVSLKAENFVDQFEVLQRMLSYSEAEKAKSFSLENLRFTYLVHRAMLRVLIAKIIMRAPEDITIAEAANGKPFLSDQRLHFNMSHSSSTALYAFTLDSEVGIDMEIDDNQIAIDSLIPWCFSPDEEKEVQALNKHAQRHAFFKLWTKKESLSKCCGQGLRLDFSEINLGLRPEPNTIKFCNSIITVFDISTSYYHAALSVRGFQIPPHSPKD